MTGLATNFEELSQPQERGQATEAIIKAAFLVRGVPVLLPEYDNEPYDFVIELDGSFYKLQAKTAYQHSEGTVRFETVSTRVRSDGYERDGYAGQIDYFVVYDAGRSAVYLIPIEEAAKGKMEIRFKEPANGQESGINWYEDYLLDEQLDRTCP